MSKYTALINDVRFEFDYARISSDGKMSLEFVSKRPNISRHSKPAIRGRMSRTHSSYNEMLEGLKAHGALAPIVISKGA